MPPEAEGDELGDDLLDSDDDLLKPEPEEPAAEAGPAETKPEKPAEPQAEKPAAVKAPEKPRPAPRPVAAERAQRNGGWMVWALIVLLLLAAVIGVGWYANVQRMQVADLKGQLETAKTQATGMQATAAKAAVELLPLVEEQATLAKLRAASGDTEGAKYSLGLAKRYADMAERLSAGSRPGKLDELNGLIGEAEKALGGGAATAAPSEPAAAPTEPATGGEQPAAKAEEAAP
jgi:cell division septation protein DedD